MDVVTTSSDQIPSPAFWDRKRVLLTGHSGFKGSWLTVWLEQLGAQVLGLSLPERETQPNLCDALGPGSTLELPADLCTPGWEEAVRDFAPQIVLHLAAQALVPIGYAEPLRTFATNVTGTALLLDALGRCESVSSAVMVTTDKVYDTRQTLPFAEDAFLGGGDPYAASKAAMELVVHSWPQLGFPVATARAGNVIGGGDWSTDRLLPDIVRAWSTGQDLLLRRPSAVRPWQHVLEPLRGYLLLAEALVSVPEIPRALNLGPDESQCVPVSDVVAFTARYWRERKASFEPRWTSHDVPPIQETELLVLDSSLAATTLGWANMLDWQTAVAHTVDWHLAHAAGTSARDLVQAEIAGYEQLVGRGP
ncbi:MAG: CDP-glucose 4,6-dehydratase [Marmoricola sp.]